jgi:hypothetical protein
MTEQPAGAGVAGSGSTLSPDAVVGVGIEALRTNDEPYENYGIERVYDLLTPEVRRGVGSLPRFVALVRREYAPLLVADRVGTTPVETVGDRATQEVTVVAPDGAETVYEFGLARRSGGADHGRWLVDRVSRLA